MEVLVEHCFFFTKKKEFAQKTLSFQSPYTGHMSTKNSARLKMLKIVCLLTQKIQFTEMYIFVWVPLRALNVDWEGANELWTKYVGVVFQ